MISSAISFSSVDTAQPPVKAGATRAIARQFWSTRAVPKNPDPLFWLRTTLNDSPQAPPTANRQPPTATNRQPPPTATNRQPPPNTSLGSRSVPKLFLPPPPTLHDSPVIDQAPATIRQQPPSVECQSTVRQLPSSHTLRPALQCGVVPPPPPWGMTVSSAPTAHIRPPSPPNRFKTARTATTTALQPPVTTAAADPEPSLQPPSPSSAASAYSPSRMCFSRASTSPRHVAQNAFILCVCQMVHEWHEHAATARAPTVSLRTAGML